MNAYLKYIFATTYKNHKKSKYVIELLNLYKSDYIKDITYELSGNIEEILNDNITRPIFEHYATSTQEFYLIQLLLDYCKDDKKTLEYRFILANQSDQTSVMNIT